MRQPLQIGRYEWLVAPCVGNTIADQDDVDAIGTQVVRSTDAPIVAALDSERQAALVGTFACPTFTQPDEIVRLSASAP